MGGRTATSAMAVAAAPTSTPTRAPRVILLRTGGERPPVRLRVGSARPRLRLTQHPRTPHRFEIGLHTLQGYTTTPGAACETYRSGNREGWLAAVGRLRAGA